MCIRLRNRYSDEGKGKFRKVGGTSCAAQCKVNENRSLSDLASMGRLPISASHYHGCLYQSACILTLVHSSVMFDAYTNLMWLDIHAYVEHNNEGL